MKKQKVKKERQPGIIKRVSPYMGKKKIFLPTAIVLSGFSGGLLIIPFILMWVIIREIVKDPANLNMAAVKPYIIGVAVSAVLAVIFYFLALLLSHMAAFRVEIGIQKVGIKKVLNMPLGYFDTTETGRIRKAINDSAGVTHGFLAHNLPDLGGAMLTPVVILIMIFAVDWRIGLAALFPIVVAMIKIATMYGKQGAQKMREYFGSLEKMSSEAVEYVRGIPVVKTFGQSVHSFRNFYDSIVQYRKYVVDYTLGGRVAYTIAYVLTHSISFFIIPVAFILLNQGESIGLVITNIIFYLIITASMLPMIMRVMRVGMSKQAAVQALDNIDKILDYPIINFKEEEVTMDKYDIEIKNISFAYEKDGKKAIDGISLKVKEGETVALVGPSGSGKTTLARLVARFWDADEGDIVIGGVDIKDIPKEQLMKKISFVFQNTELLSKSIKENIVLGQENITDEDIQKAIKLSQSQDIIDELPDGINTVMGTKGTYLSGGQKQRISLARAILKDAPIVLLDEATAFADPENEHLIQKALKELSKGKTTLMIAHRLSTVKDLDRIVVLDQGKIAEQGTHEELMKLNGLYKSMFDEYQESIEWKISSEVVGEVN